MSSGALDRSRPLVRLSGRMRSTTRLSSWTLLRKGARPLIKDVWGWCQIQEGWARNLGIFSSAKIAARKGLRPKAARKAVSPTHMFQSSTYLLGPHPLLSVLPSVSFCSCIAQIRFFSIVHENGYWSWRLHHNRHHPWVEFQQIHL